MANYDDILNAAQRRTRTGRSFFPAANGTYRGINYTLGGQPSANAVNSSPTGQTITPSRYGTSSAVLPPDQNPAYQAAISKGRPNTSAYTWITTPSGGSMRVPTSYAFQPKTGTALEGSFVNPATGPLSPAQYASAWNRGVGAPNPSINPTTGTLATGGIEKPIEQLTPGQRALYGTPLGVKETSLQAAGNFSPANVGLVNNQQYASNIGAGLPNFSQIGQQLGTFAHNVASWFGGGNMPSMPPSTAATQPTPTPYAIPTPTPTPQGYSDPRRYSDLGYY